MHILGGLRLIIAVHVEFTARSIAPHGLTHGKAAKLLVKRTLNAFKPLAVHTDETEQLASHLTVRVNTLEFAGQLDARKVRLPDGLGRGVVHAAGNPDKAALFFQQGFDLIDRTPEHPGQRRRRGLYVRDDARIRVYGTALHAAGEDMAVAIGDHAAGHGHGFGGHMLPPRAFGKKGAFPKLDIPGPDPQRTPHNEKKHRHRTEPDAVPVNGRKPCARPAFRTTSVDGLRRSLSSRALARAQICHRNLTPGPLGRRLLYPGFRPRIGHPPNLTGFGLAHAELDGFTAQYMRSQQPIPFHFKFGFEDGALLHLIPELTDGVCLIRTLNTEPHQREPHKQAQQQRNDEGQQPAARRHLAHARSRPSRPCRARRAARLASYRRRAASSPESSSA